MSFSDCAARSFTLTSIINNAPELPGVYGLCNQREWIFIAEAANIRASLLEQLRTAGSAVAFRNPSGFTFEVCAPGVTAARKLALTNQFKPSCNQSSERRPRR